jgi:hypothetical protein
MTTEILIAQMTLRDMLAAGATERDVDEILMENIQNYTTDWTKIHNRQSARWEHAARMLALRKKSITTAAMPNEMKTT